MRFGLCMYSAFELATTVRALCCLVTQNGIHSQPTKTWALGLLLDGQGTLLLWPDEGPGIQLVLLLDDNMVHNPPLLYSDRRMGSNMTCRHLAVQDGHESKMDPCAFATALWILGAIRYLSIDDSG